MMLRSASRPFMTVARAESVSGSLECSSTGDGMRANELTFVFSISGMIMSRLFSMWVQAV